ncbi:hypothetical protein FQA39_LY08003 [Lamprigera yunnana]|nr:hypothetical protein FQA39_LY08003 [Lamprigera yunnana]
MKALLFVVLCLAPVIFTKHSRGEILEEWDKVLSKYKIECIKESGVNRDDAMDIETILTFPDYQNFKCYIKCLQQNLNCIDTEENDIYGSAAFVITSQTDLLHFVNMKVVLFVGLGLVPVIFTKYSKDELHQDWDKGVNEDVGMDSEKYMIFPNDQNFKCYVECVQQNLNTLDTEGNFNVQTVEKLFTGTSKEMTHKCLQEIPNEKDICKKAYDFIKCIIKEAYDDNDIN